ncbi:MAG: trypsin-like peptidase domain-containing protein [Clostridiales bacterium]|nr:trypsin-like peptidase domain-containing protein [Clostridiales bacterium]
MFEDEKRDQSMSDSQNIEEQQEDIFAEPDVQAPEESGFVMMSETKDRTDEVRDAEIGHSAQETAYNAAGQDAGDGASAQGTPYTQETTYRSAGQDAGNGQAEDGLYRMKGDGAHEHPQQQYSYIPQDRDPRDARPPRKRKKNRGNVYAKAIGCAILCGLIIGGCIIGSFAIGKNVVATSTTVETTSAKLSEAESDDTDSTEETAEATTVSSSGTEYTVAQIAEMCSSSVVAITNKSVSEVQTMFGTYEQESEGSGSGVIVAQTDTELLIATNYHVIEGSTELTVCFLDSEDYMYSAQTKGTSEENDLAVVAVQISDIDEEVLSQISIATVGDSDSLQVGDSVVAIGNALGLGQSVTSGIISALDREITIDDVTYTLIQTDAAINAGNSGGALFNMKGELVGINTAKFSSDSSSSSASIDNMGFAIPMSKAESILEELMTQETRTKLTENYGALNITGYDVSTEAASLYGMPEGVYVYSVVEGGAAEAAGIQAGDIITALDGSSVTSIDTLKEKLQYYAAGETAEVTLQRSGSDGYEEITVTVTLDNASEQDTSSTENSSMQDSQSNTDVSGGMQDSQSDANAYGESQEGSSGFSFR